MINTPLVTIMIPTYNQQDCIRRAVESALGQNYPNLEVIVADDASPDDTASVVREISDKRLRYHRNPQNLGRVANYHNTLYNLAAGEFVVNLDGDDYYIDNNFISNAMKLIGLHQNIVLVSARCKTITPTRELLSGLSENKVISGFTMLENLTKSEYRFKHMTTLYNRKLAMEIGFYRIDLLSADWESLYKLVSCGNVAYLSDVVGVWNLHGDNASLSIKQDELFANIQIWDSVFDAAAAHGMPLRDSDKVKKRMKNLVSYGNVSAIIRSGTLLSIKPYLDLLYKNDRNLFYQTVFNIKFILKICIKIIYPKYFKLI